MRATKGNKVYSINETEKKYYIAQGYDILDDEGNITDYGAGKSVAYKKYIEMQEENEKLKEENKKLKSENKELKKAEK